MPHFIQPEGSFSSPPTRILGQKVQSQWRTGQGVNLPDGKWALWAPLNIRQYVTNVNMYNICTL
jgi:hypothetical protein